MTAAMTFSSAEVKRRAGLTNITRWTDRFARRRNGCGGGGYEWTVGQLIVARALRDWPAPGPVDHAGQNRHVFNCLAQYGPALIDAEPVPPAFVGVIDGTVGAFATAEQAAGAVRGARRAHLIDVHVVAHQVGVA